MLIYGSYDNFNSSSWCGVEAPRLDFLHRLLCCTDSLLGLRKSLVVSAITTLRLTSRYYKDSAVREGKSMKLYKLLGNKTM